MGFDPRADPPAVAATKRLEKQEVLSPQQVQQRNSNDEVNQRAVVSPHDSLAAHHRRTRRIQAPGAHLNLRQTANLCTHPTDRQKPHVGCACQHRQGVRRWRAMVFVLRCEDLQLLTQLYRSPRLTSPALGFPAKRDSAAVCSDERNETTPGLWNHATHGRRGLGAA